ncbi:hypothetical protein MRB53_008559 [Persea americana]|uniref:Uncharacterized protein n=1 Tax=Persea americana TaxID=3435 RepID=A0ACC2MM44_PERAE|nr:hypothetical protein MRB53_008559 [Persea americana]|eukprot:TRINITY_DN1596_c0_g1_i16.p1 TRINITY_DN1596_c0_g1~~TRINITY_DN1596_c0_g1_i16.p1  ORF type:complete len:381 (-),score=117.62 TRINITY_DN1596_c0_g1_i16:346-1488(-)
MGNGEVDAPTKTPKSSSLAQEQPPPSSPATLFPDWASYQAYYNPAGTPPIPPPGFFHSSMASSPQAHPYMWGPQHMVPPYGTPPPYVAMYHGGVYAHPSIPPGSHLYGPYAMPSNGTPGVSVAAAGGTDESAEGERSPLKNSKGSLGSLNMLTGKDSEVGKTSGASGNGAMSQSGESGNEGSSEGSDANSRDGSQQKPCCEQGSHADNGSSICSAPCGVTGAAPTQTMANLTMTMMGIPPSSVPGPTANLNIGMDFWGGHPPTSIATMKVMATSSPVTVPIAPAHLNGSQDVFPPELWLQDERELKRQRRKQSNRESARRSRLRKQAECEELAKHVETLQEEHSSLKDELQHMREEHEKLAAENASLTEKLEKHGGKESR